MRVSDEKQAKAFGMEGQMSACESYCDRHDLVLVRSFDDEAKSGRKAQRSGLESAIDFIREQKEAGTPIRYFVTTEMSRISRNWELATSLEIRSRIEQLGCEVLSLKYLP